MSIAGNLMNPSKMGSTMIQLAVGLLILVALLPTVITAIINISTVPNLSFASFFAGGGVVLIALSASVVLALVGFFMAKKSGR